MSKFLEDLKDFIVKNGYQVYSAAETKDFNEPESVDIIPGNDCQNVYSISKAVTVTALGVLFDQGVFAPSGRVIDLLEEECPKNLDPAWQKITAHMLLTHSAGLPGGCLDIDCIDSRTFGEDYLDYLMRLPLVAAPGTERIYSDGAFYLLARILEHIAKENLLTFCWRKLFYPMGVKEAAWSTDNKGHSMGATGLYIRSEDIVKIAELYLEKGCYLGKRFLSEKWVETVLSNGYEMRPTAIGDIYGKGGMHGQAMFVVPEQNRCVAYTAYDKVDGDAIKRFTLNYKN